MGVLFPNVSDPGINKVGYCTSVDLILLLIVITTLNLIVSQLDEYTTVLPKRLLDNYASKNSKKLQLLDVQACNSANRAAFQNLKRWFIS